MSKENGSKFIGAGLTVGMVYTFRVPMQDHKVVSLGEAFLD